MSGGNGGTLTLVGGTIHEYTGRAVVKMADGVYVPYEQWVHEHPWPNVVVDPRTEAMRDWDERFAAARESR